MEEGREGRERRRREGGRDGASVGASKLRKILETSYARLCTRAQCVTVCVCGCVACVCDVSRATQLQGHQDAILGLAAHIPSTAHGAGDSDALGGVCDDDNNGVSDVEAIARARAFLSCSRDGTIRVWCGSQCVRVCLCVCCVCVLVCAPGSLCVHQVASVCQLARERLDVI